MPSFKPKTIIIGAGKISWSITSALVKAGVPVINVVSKNVKSAEQLALKFGIENYSSSLNDIDPSANLFVLAVPDGQIAETALLLSRLPLQFNRSFFVHLSGAKSSSEMISLRKKGGSIASLHIMQTFPSKKLSI